MLVNVVTPPASEPISLAELKGHLRVLHDTEDVYLDTLIAAARMHLEETSGAAIATRTLDGFLSGFPRGGIVLPQPPLQSVVSIKYRDHDGATQTLAPERYHVETVQRPGRIHLLSGNWPSTQVHPHAVEVRFVAGFDAIPADFKHAMKLLCGHWYFNRELAGDGRSNAPFAVEALVQKYRTHGWM